MRALTIRQPFASLITVGFKKTEYRTWDTKHRGDVAISVSSAWKGSADGEYAQEPKVVRALARAGLTPATLPLAAIIAVVTLKSITESEEYPGEYEWHLTNVRRFRTPVPTAGKLGLWNLSPQLEAQVAAALKALAAA